MQYYSELQGSLAAAPAWVRDKVLLLPGRNWKVKEFGNSDAEKTQRKVKKWLNKYRQRIAFNVSCVRNYRVILLLRFPDEKAVFKLSPLLLLVFLSSFMRSQACETNSTLCSWAAERELRQHPGWVGASPAASNCIRLVPAWRKTAVKIPIYGEQNLPAWIIISCTL